MRTSAVAALVLTAACAGRVDVDTCNDDRDCPARERCADGACAPRDEDPVAPDDAGAAVPDAGAGLDAGARADAGFDEGGRSDAGGDGGDDGVDAGARDAGVTDAGVLDAGALDAGAIDGGAADAGDCEGTAPSGCDADDASLVGCWTFDADLPTIVKDGSSYGHHGTAQGVEHVPGVVGTALRVDDDVGGHVEIGGSPSLTPSDAVSVAAWVQLESPVPANGRYGVVDQNGVYALFVYEDGPRCFSHGASASASPPLPVGVWVHLACTASSTGGVRLYVDGVERAVVPAQAPGAAAPSLRIGSNDPSGDHLDGVVDEVRVWTRARSPAEVCRDARR